MRFLVLLALGSSLAFADPMSGKWKLNLARTHYGPGVSVRKQETFDCHQTNQILSCTIQSLREDGKKLVASFAAPYDGTPHPVTGMPDISDVSLRKVDDFVLDATFSKAGTPVFGYRVVKSSDGRSLTIVSVDPVTRAILNSVVAYDRQQ